MCVCVFILLPIRNRETHATQFSESLFSPRGILSGTAPPLHFPPPNLTRPVLCSTKQTASSAHLPGADQARARRSKQRGLLPKTCFPVGLTSHRCPLKSPDVPGTHGDLRQPGISLPDLLFPRPPSSTPNPTGRAGGANLSSVPTAATLLAERRRSPSPQSGPPAWPESSQLAPVPRLYCQPSRLTPPPPPPRGSKALSSSPFY